MTEAIILTIMILTIMMFSISWFVGDLMTIKRELRELREKLVPETDDKEVEDVKK